MGKTPPIVVGLGQGQGGGIMTDWIRIRTMNWMRLTPSDARRMIVLLLYPCHTNRGLVLSGSSGERVPTSPRN
jgi:hypothetical protein